MTPILVISYEGPPRLTHCSLATTKALAAVQPFLEHVVFDLLCASISEDVSVDEGLETLLPESARVHRIDPFQKGRQTILQRIIGGQGGWQNAAVGKGAALFPAEHKKPALIYSRSHPPASNLAALDLVNGPFQSVPWVAEFNEPWRGNPFYKSPVTRAALGRYERQVFDAATRLVFTSEALRDSMLAGGDETWLAKAHVIPPAYNSEWYGKAGLPILLSQKKPTGKVIAHLGTLHPFRKPHILYEGIARMRHLHPGLAAELSLWLVGSLDVSFANLEVEAGVAEHVRFVSPVPYLESLAVMKAADVLLLVDPPVKKNVILPSKLIDYLGARKPILAITSRGSLTARLMDAWGQPWCDCSDGDAVAAQLRRVASGELWAAPADTFLNDYRSDTVGRKLAALISSCIADVNPAYIPGANQNPEP